MAPDPQPLPRLDRWLRRQRLRVDGLTLVGAELVDHRLAIRRRVDRGSAVAFLGALTCFVVSVLTFRAVPGRRPDASLWWLSAALVILPSAIFFRSIVIRRYERQLAARLPWRVAGDRAIPAWRRIGPIRLGIAVVVAGLAGVTLLAIAQSSVPAASVALYAVLLLVLAVNALLLTRSELSRAALAVDDISLRLDERWRSQAVYGAVCPLLVLFGSVRLFLPLDLSTLRPDWLAPVLLFSVVLIPLVNAAEHAAQAVDRRRVGRPPLQSWQGS